MQKFLLIPAGLGCLLTTTLALAQQAAPPVPLPQTPKAEWVTPQARFGQAAQLLEEQRFGEALVILEALERDSPTVALYWNISLAAAKVGDSQKALAAVDKAVLLAPQSVVLRSRRVQALQALGRLEERDRERLALVQLWKSGVDKEFGRQPLYVREQWYQSFGEAGAERRERVVAIEYFEPQPPFRRQYAFLAFDPAGKLRYKVTMESPDPTNQFALDMGQRKADERIYSLDGYQELGKQVRHDTWQFFTGEPSYEAVRAAALDVLAGNRTPKSSSTRPMSPAGD